jgi:hypothetical protein
VTVTGWPATVSAAVRDDVPAFAVTLKRTVPLPVPVAPDVIEIQLTFSDAVHVQPGGAVTSAVMLPPALVTGSVEDVTA